MIFPFFWGLMLGVGIGINVVFAYLWLSLRRKNRKAAKSTWGMLTDTDTSDIVNVKLLSKHDWTS